MTPKELQRIHVIQQCIDGILTNGETAHNNFGDRHYNLRSHQTADRENPEPIN